MQRRTWTTDEKLAIVMAGLKQIQSVAGLCRAHQISQTQYYKWRDPFLEGGKQALMGAKHDATKQFERKVEQVDPYPVSKSRSSSALRTKNGTGIAFRRRRSVPVGYLKASSVAASKGFRPAWSARIQS